MWQQKVTEKCSRVRVAPGWLHFVCTFNNFPLKELKCFHIDLSRVPSENGRRTFSYHHAAPSGLFSNGLLILEKAQLSGSLIFWLRTSKAPTAENPSHDRQMETCVIIFLWTRILACILKEVRTCKCSSTCSFIQIKSNLAKSLAKYDSSKIYSYVIY